MSTAKSDIIEWLFEQRWDTKAARLRESVVTLEEVAAAITHYNKGPFLGNPISTKNPANFFKDFVRKRVAANANWPRSVFLRGYTAQQKTGGGDCFEFVRVAPGQTEPFPTTITLPPPTKKRHLIESASLPLASRRLGRSDEPWLVQVLVRLRVIETHLSISSAHKILQVDHLQMSVKLRTAEIDALFLAIEELGKEQTRELIICCEAKGRNDDILIDQVLRQTRAVFDLDIKQDHVLPMAVKAIGPSEVFVVEFDVVSRQEAPAIETLTVASSEVYRFTPLVPGIGR